MSTAAALAEDLKPAAEQVEAAAAQAVCANCGAGLLGRYCHDCGQKTELHTRLGQLLADAFRNLLHLDGRLWRTIPAALFRPGRLSREWREGKRVRYVAPLPFSLFCAFASFLADSLEDRISRWFGGPPERTAAAPDVDPRPTERWFDQLTDGAYSANPDLYDYRFENLLEQSIIGLAPVSMLLLVLLFPRRRGVTLYDHAVVSLYGVSVLFLALIAATLLVPITNFMWVLFWSGLFVHMVVHLRGAYGLGWAGAFGRGVALGFLSLVAFPGFIFGLMVLSLVL